MADVQQPISTETHPLASPPQATELRQRKKSKATKQTTTPPEKNNNNKAREWVAKNLIKLRTDVEGIRLMDKETKTKILAAIQRDIDGGADHISQDIVKDMTQALETFKNQNKK